MMISVWKNPTAIFILIGVWMTEQSQVKHELSFCAKVLLGEYMEYFLLKNLGYWNAYNMEFDSFFSYMSVNMPLARTVFQL